MAIFRYKRTRELAPKEGQKFSTTYYQQSLEEFNKTKQHVTVVAEEIMEFIEQHPDWQIFVDSPLKKFPRLNGLPNYSIAQILADMLQQMASGKDIPSGMLGRWNRLFDGTEYDIELLQEYDPTHVSPKLFENLFAG